MKACTDITQCTCELVPESVYELRERIDQCFYASFSCFASEDMFGNTIKKYAGEFQEVLEGEEYPASGYYYSEQEAIVRMYSGIMKYIQNRADEVDGQIPLIITWRKVPTIVCVRGLYRLSMRLSMIFVSGNLIKNEVISRNQNIVNYLRSYFKEHLQ